MKRVMDKVIEAVVYSIVMFVLICVMIDERWRAPLYALSGWAIFGATLLAMVELLLGGEDAPLANSLHKLTLLIFAAYAICFAGVMAFDGFGELLGRVLGG